ncbi:hypothetical protein [Elizabethkingia argenteiflava]|uniref:hypothetical protein n=1 Tax=Elizabethkingia argenteiflava TaxID=2681556 RepID=UPI0014130FFF|nr:hypothetical protein [Elizabethkingia argenteiflava]
MPKSHNRKSFVRYTSADNYLTIDFCVSVEGYEKKYNIEQRFDLGVIFLTWLDKGFTNKKIIENNPNLTKRILKIGQKNGWFVDEIDWSLDLDN